MHHGWLWFPNRPGLISGIIIGGFGFGALAFGPIASKLVNPNNENQDADGHFPTSVSDRVPYMLQMLDVLFLGFCLISLFLIFPGPDPTEINKALE